jgi:hypothetical protein
MYGLLYASTVTINRLLNISKVLCVLFKKKVDSLKFLRVSTAQNRILECESLGMMGIIQIFNQH